MAWERGRAYNSGGGGRRSGAFSRSGWATAIVIALVLLTFGLLWHAHQRAKFHQLTTPIIPQTTSAPMPGGQEAILLSRVTLVNDSEPEFVSATVLPGVGMQLLQATVAVPDQPAQDLLASVSLSDAARMSPVSISSAPFHLRVSNHHVQEGKGNADDLIGFAPASNPQNQTLVDGGQASGTFQGTAARAGVSATIEVTLSGRQIDLITRATNNSQENRFVSFEWCPRFAAPDGNLNRLLLSVPSGSKIGADGESEAAGIASEHGQAIGDHPLDVHLTHLGHESLSDGTYVRLQNGERFSLRVIGLGDTLRSVHARSDPGTHTLLLSLSSLDPAAEAEQRDQTLRAGQTIQWHLRMEVLPVKAPQSPEPMR
ncbi:hypothetical protein [Terriglobus sp.]|uniref:hypothetical protein n=1 Tax=Terriglobus sp. TaxID=1889013 RepID=UPI003B00CE38